MTDFKMPSLGADMEAGTLVEWRKKPGDLLQPGDIIAEVDTQKGLIEIEVFEGGILDKYLIEVGDKVPVGTPMASLRPEGTTGVPAKEVKEQVHPIQEKEKPEEAQATEHSEKVNIPSKEKLSEEKSFKDKPSEETSSEEKLSEEKHRIKISPLARTIAEKNRLDLSGITGTGEGGAIIKADVEKAMAAKKEEKHEETLEKKIEEQVPERPVKEQKTTEPAAAGISPQESIRKAVAAAMSLSNREIPHYYLEKRIDMLKALTWLKETNQQREISARLMPAVLFIKAVAKAIDSAPALNAVWENGLQLKNEINIGFVVSLRSGGILVPAIKNADLKSTDEIMISLNDIIPRARAMRLRSSELSESTITLTSLGENGADKVFGVIYPPQVAIVGFGSIIDEPVVQKGMLAFRPVVHVTLAGDHRATDGLTGSRFLEALNNHLQNPETL
ncbi:dihydrolipoamide acetyltransferase family protein [Salinimicrobium sp. TH3]|uniref:dihydrolipoamide acetyltransferase family protein n=1 Tax=Salinimicrobium sp. TH3 TaxID=2997342 RepID=UPI002274AA35|nr:dihydrolipoamide acetyltransferase family protein [Salinimicrobium sp. TH3]MCY2685877.1 dihydrolipoamide acetyltransferase family protein [Salinimicrobium sp. TH3]